MKATCKLCNATIETPPDPNMDEGRERRELNTFWNRVAAHIDPRTRQCTANDQKLVHNRFAMAQQDNGWFQRWRLLACLNVLEPRLIDKQTEWRDYLHAITMQPETPAEEDLPYVCENPECQWKTAEYINGCPKCAELGLHFSVRAAAKVQ